jgi:hypothetical protein
MGPPDVIPHTLSALGHIVDGIVGRALLRMGIDNSLYYQWPGMG